MSAEAFGSRSEGKVTAERYNASEKVSRKLSKQNYVFEKLKWDKNRFAGIWNRYDISGGLGRELLKLPDDSIIIELSGGYVNEERIGSPREEFASGKVYGKYTRTLSKTASFLQDAEYLHNFQAPDGYRLNMSSSLLASLSTHMSIKVSYTWKYVNMPPKGFIRSDTATSVALIVNY